MLQTGALAVLNEAALGLDLDVAEGQSLESSALLYQSDQLVVASQLVPVLQLGRGQRNLDDRRVHELNEQFLEHIVAQLAVVEG